MRVPIVELNFSFNEVYLHLLQNWHTGSMHSAEARTTIVQTVFFFQENNNQYKLSGP
jgi:hypothetical protein